ncbi:MAG: NAD(P)/FAD-dependent oxidoreductase [Spirochaetaceae bacterium]|jgi:dihydrolipoamide dehydrogenase|nr:NAD(P)/FAD-dependent oxidoreductase [Spirochaetaceae bacterium]
MENKFDLIIIGAGCAGAGAAYKARSLGLSVCIVENRDVGGTCLNRGCIPTKTLLHSAALLDDSRNGSEFGVETGEAGGKKLDFAKLSAWKNTVISTLRQGQTSGLEKAGVVIERGTARVEAAGKVSIAGEGGTKMLEARAILVATGTVPAKVPVPGGKLPGVYTSDDFLEGEGLFPKRLVVFGAGVIAVEFAFAYSGFGSEVSIIARRTIFASLEREIGQTVTMQFKKRGIAVYPQSGIAKIEQDGNSLNVHLPDGKIINTDAVLMATGREADASSLFAASCTPEITDKGFIKVDDSMQSTIPGIFAAGEIAGGVQLAHAAEADGDYAGECIAHALSGGAGGAGGGGYASKKRIIPACVYTTPEIACAGMTGDEAKARGIPAVTGKGVFGANGKAFLEKQERAFIKLVFHQENKKLIGAQFLCNHATEMIPWAVQCIEAGISAHQIEETIFAHPTYNETIKAAAKDAITRGGL